MTDRMSHKRSFGGAGSPFNMFFLSFLIHLLVLAAIITTVPGTSRPLTFGAPYFVALVGQETLKSPDPIGSVNGLLKNSSGESGVVFKRHITSSQTSSLVKKNEGEKLDIEKAISAIKQKNIEDKPVERSVAPPVAVATSESERAQVNDYTRVIWAKIKNNWTLPADLMPKNQVETIIDIRIGQSGALEHIGFEKRSGHRYFDESALRAVKKSAPFPPLAGMAPGRSIEVGIRFHSSELRSPHTKDRP